jgi:transposase InsO family protein
VRRVARFANSRPDCDFAKGLATFVAFCSASLAIRSATERDTR